MADEQPEKPAARAPENAAAAPTEQTPAQEAPRWSGSAAVPPHVPKRPWWSRRAPDGTPPAVDPWADSEDWSATPAVDPWADQDTPWQAEMPFPEAMPPTRIDSPLSPTRLDPPLPPTRTEPPLPPTRLESPLPPTRPESPPPQTRHESPIPPTRLESSLPPTRAEAAPARPPAPAAGVGAGLPLAAPPPTGPPPAAGSEPRRSRWGRKKRAKEAQAAPVNRLPVQPRPALPPPARPPLPPARPTQTRATQTRATQTRPAPPPPPWAPAQGRPPAGPPAKRPPPLPRRKRRWPRNLFLLTLFSLVCCCGVPAYFAWPASQQYPVSAVLPQSVGDLDLRDDGASSRAVERLSEQLRGTNLAKGEVFAGVYADGNGKRVTVFGTTGLRLTPQADVEAELAQLAGEYNIKDITPYDLGETGVHERCGVGRTGGNAVVVCAWADHGSLATVLLTRRSVSESAELTGVLRSALLTRA